MKLKNVMELQVSGFGSDGASVIIGHKKVASKLKKINPKITSICCHYYRLALPILPFLKEGTFLIKILFNILVLLIMLILTIC